ncbi:MAG: LysR family transcriptional regulator [Rhodospirillales bacterium]|nr:LysR family transcriptional regulator [Rhodospirillales bacterium]
MNFGRCADRGFVREVTPFRPISVFYSLARFQSVAKAAAELGVTPSAVSQQVRVLEKQLGATLVTKKGRQIRLTETGERFFEMIASDIEHIVDATQQISGARKATLLTIRATPSISTKWLLPRMPRFANENPMLDIRLDGTNEPTDFSRDDVDVEIRHGTGEWPGLFIHPLTDEYFLPVCSPQYAAPFSMRPEEITGKCLIHSVKSQVQWKRWFAQQNIPSEGGWRKIYFDRSHMAVDAAVVGMGIALESMLMMEKELKEGLLITPVIDPPRMTLKTQWLVCPHHHLRRSKVKRFIDWVTREAENWHESITQKI